MFDKKTKKRLGLEKDISSYGIISRRRRDSTGLMETGQDMGLGLGASSSSSLQNASEEFEETDTSETQDDPRVMLSESMERTFYGLLGKPLALEVVNLLKVEKCLEMPNELPPPPTGLTQNHRESLLSPPVMRDLKIPSTRGFTGSSGDFKEKPLYDHALTLRKILIPLTAIHVIAKNPEASPADFRLLLNLAASLREEVIDELKTTNWKRFVVKIPDSDTRQILLSDSNSMINSQPVIAALARAKTVKKALPRGFADRFKIPAKTPTTKQPLEKEKNPPADATSKRGGSRGRGGKRGKRG